VGHTMASGRGLFELGCELDLEGIMAKQADSPYNLFKLVVLAKRISGHQRGKAATPQGH